MYQPNTVDVIHLTLPPESIVALESEPDEYVPGTFSLAETEGTPGTEKAPSTPLSVEIRLKGNVKGSFRSLAGKAAFKVKFKKSQKFLGLRKMTLNNMVDDPSQIHETLAYSAFRGAGVPAPRTGYAYLFVNGEDFGLHLNIETVDVVALEKWFGVFHEPPQHLYEGEDGVDVRPGEALAFEIDEGKEEERADLEALIGAVNTAAPAFSPRVAGFADLGEMTRMWAVEKYIGDWDSYSGQQGEALPNNYYLYSDPAGRFQMIPWGADQTWEPGHRLQFDGQAGLLFDDCLEDPACATTYRESLRAATVEIASLDLSGLGERTAALLLPWEQMEQSNSRHEHNVEEIEAAVEGVHEFIATRPGEAAAWLATHTPPAIAATGPLPVAPVGCVVPRLKGKNLTSAKNRSRRADCRIGKVTKKRGATAKTGKVIKQSPRPGRLLAPGSKVSVWLRGGAQSLVSSHR